MAIFVSLGCGWIGVENGSENSGTDTSFSDSVDSVDSVNDSQTVASSERVTDLDAGPWAQSDTARNSDTDSGGNTDSNSGSDTDTAVVTGNDSSPVTDSVADIHFNTDTNIGTAGDTAGGDTATEVHSQTHADTDLDSETRADTAVESETVTGIDSDSDSQLFVDAAVDAESGDDAGSGDFVLDTPADGDHFFRLEPVTFSGTTPGRLEVFCDDDWPLGETEAAGPFSFEYPFNRTGARPITFVVDGVIVHEMIVNIEHGDKEKICISPGHPTAEGDQLYEAIINRKVAFYLEEMLGSAGYQTNNIINDIRRWEIFDPDFDNEGIYEQSLLQVMTLEERVIACNDWEADYFIAIHHNAFSDPSVNYALTLYAERVEGEPYNSATVDWATYTSDYFEDVMNVTAGYTYGDQTFLGYGLYVLQNTTMPAILTEASFQTNPEERLFLNQDDYLEGEAGAIFDGFIEFMTNI